jgi:hypothetical protein
MRWMSSARLAATGRWEAEVCSSRKWTLPFLNMSTRDVGKGAKGQAHIHTSSL